MIRVRCSSLAGRVAVFGILQDFSSQGDVLVLISASSAGRQYVEVLTFAPLQPDGNNTSTLHRIYFFPIIAGELVEMDANRQTNNALIRAATIC